MDAHSLGLAVIRSPQRATHMIAWLHVFRDGTFAIEKEPLLVSTAHSQVGFLNDHREGHIGEVHRLDVAAREFGFFYLSRVRRNARRKERASQCATEQLFHVICFHVLIYFTAS